ncbi:adenosylmethionine decarboxylase [Clostridium estertheticum]|uniref:S-adenosylmethionine decarboxylase proenzyme n=1 Tax=Clostridium estertheticum subsp. estertheticum TaxID=1552 RepID=A0A1J0GM33_9CLOT|nr:adenosylmethionine decarboxylase [Clostridium estertheticum]APC42000.1 S-adenosylmethionine decarboxylase [Clostridium estertheticum subsp. estertheticum]MBU3075891.1 adenosylmethionine decarboxylase [Clostridium estertheticum]MBU3165853.1 adenosylmethionine decarboxylase [Clostridium estertheticum]MBU3172932.1 adenosylmethionine decarboxylase [Clostridium estertheticum]MBU3184006.1 adenosylmethionine decarboxylase [Clostridium estertheticum]
MAKNDKNKIKLYGFNNLTKSLSFNIYDVCYTKTIEDRKKYIEYIDEQYNAERLTKILTDVTQMIGASVLNIAKQDYDPQGASVTLLISEEEIPLYVVDPSCNRGILTPIRENIVGHLDKSHVTVHTYPESHPQNDISTFRVDIDVATCGEISPLKALNYLIDSFDSDIITIDYKVRGFTRDMDGKKHFIDHEINSIQNYIAKETIDRYTLMDMNIYQSNIFHTKMILNDFELDNYLFEIKQEDLNEDEKASIVAKLDKEMKEIFYGMDISND